MPRNHVTNKTWSGLVGRIKLAFMISVIYIIFNIIGIGCPIKFLTGISCPGCGMTRAVLAAIQLKFHEAFYYHPLFFLVPLIMVLYLFEDYLKPLYVKYLWGVISIAFLTVYFLRLFIFKSDIVSFDIPIHPMLKLVR